MDAERMGRFIAAARKERGMTQAQLAAKLFVSDKTVSKWERGLGFPDIRSLEPLAAALGVTLVELMRGERSEAAFLSVQAAEQMLAQTLQISRTRKPVGRVLGWSALLLFGAAILGLAWLLLREGQIVFYSVVSLCLGLAAWLVPVVGLTWGRPRGAAAVLVSMSLAAASVATQFFQIARDVRLGDWSALEDTIRTLAMVVALFTALTVLLNGLLTWRSRGRPGSLPACTSGQLLGPRRNKEETR